MGTNNATNTSNPITVAQGGTGLATLTAHCVLVGEGTSNVTPITIGAANSILMGNTSADPGFTTSGTPYVSGISFDSGSNTLANYAVSTWTPTLDGAVSGTTTYTVQSGNYVRIGNIAIVSARIAGSAATGTGNLTLGGLPFTIKNQSNYFPTSTCQLSAFTFPAGSTSLAVEGQANTTTALIYSSGTTIAGGYVQMSNVAFVVSFTLVYQI